MIIEVAVELSSESCTVLLLTEVAAEVAPESCTVEAKTEVEMELRSASSSCTTIRFGGRFGRCR